MNNTLLVNRARELSCEMGEKSIAELLGGKKRKAQKGADLYLDAETNIEVKCRLYGQPINILVEQLLELSDQDIYALIYYRSIDGTRPLGILKQALQDKVDLANHFQSAVTIAKIFLFPVSHIRHFYDNTHMREATIRSSGLRHKGLAVSSATQMYYTAHERKSIFHTPIHTPNSQDTQTYAVGEKVNEILQGRGFVSLVPSGV